MSLIVAVRDDRDILMASDGRVLAADQSVMSDDSPKTLALNPQLCLALGGDTDSMRHVLGSLGVKCRSSHPIDLLSECEETRCPVDIGYRDARDEVARVLRWMTRRVPHSARRRRVPAVALAGRWGTDLALCGWDDPTWLADQVPLTGYSEVVFGVLPDAGSRELAEFRGIVRGERTTDDAERRLSRAVRFCARYFGAQGPVGEIVFLRRFSHGFRLTRAEEAGRGSLSDLLRPMHDETGA
jgi:hypothetical protein